MRTRWKLQNLGRWAGLLALSVGVTVLVFLGGIVLLAWQTGEGQASSLGALRDVSQALTQEADGSYTLQNFDLPQDAAAWMLLLDADGNVVWQWNKPDELPTHYTLSQVASFSRWYLMDYPVQSLVRGDGLLLAGQEKGSLWKYSVEFSQRFMARLPGWLLGMFFLALFCVLALAGLLLRRQFRREQRGRDEARSNWISGVSHDIRTPLTSIVGATNVLLEQESALTAEQRKQLLQCTNEDAEWLIRIVENLLSITRINNSEEARVKKAPEAAEEVIEGAVAKTHKHYPDVDIQVTLPDELMLVPMDPLLIEQVLVNLMENAVIHGETHRIDVMLRREGDNAVFEVSDDGKGIPLSLLPRLFDGAARSDRRSDGKRSMGIGLSVCRTVVQAHGGTIRGDNKREGGACFTVTLPMKGDDNEDQG